MVLLPLQGLALAHVNTDNGGLALLPDLIGVTHMSNPIHQTREQWLNAAVDELRPMFQALAPHPAAQRIRVTCGYPSNWKRSKALGECHPATNSADNHYEILIAPTLAKPRDVFAVLVHEVAHTCAGQMNHGRLFGQTCEALGLIPHATKGYKATSPSDAFDDLFAGIVESLGDYPHAELSTAGAKVQATRLLKCFCPSCGYTFRTTAKWMLVGMPTCVCGDTFKAEV